MMFMDGLTKRKKSTFVQNVAQGDPLPGHRDVSDSPSGFQQSHTLQVVLLYTERWGVCEEERKEEERKEERNVAFINTSAKRKKIT